MKRTVRPTAKRLLSEFSSRLDSETLNVRIYRDADAFVCERELVERDGTSFTMVFPFDEPNAARAVLTADPHYPRVRAEVGRILERLDRALRDNGNGKTAR